MIINEEYGELVDETVSDLSQAFNRILDYDESKWDKIRVAADQYARANFDVQKAVDHYERIFCNC